MEKYDALIIGFGKAGKTLAGFLGNRGEKVALIEKSKEMYGGTCINIGCIPSKSLVRSSGMSAGADAQDMASKKSRYTAGIKEKRRVTAMLRKKNYDKLASNPNIDVIDAAARFTGPKTIEALTEDGIETFTVDRIYIGTGAASFIPDIKGIEKNPHVYYSTALMDMDELPERLSIIGGGYIGMEFASIYANFGSKVTVFQDSDRFLPREDQDVADEVRKILEGQGISFRFGVGIAEIKSDGTVVDANGDEVASDAVLIATGRRPNVKCLGLENAGIELTSRGAIAVDERLHTNVPGVYAMGDVTGGLQFTYTSLDDYRVLASEINGGSYTTADRKNVPYSVFMATPLSRVGLNEQEAEKAGLDFRVMKLPVAAIPKAQVLHRTEGFLKAIVENGSDRILGVMLLCEGSPELINTVKLAMDYGADYKVLRDQVFTHPVMSEALNDLFSM